MITKRAKIYLGTDPKPIKDWDAEVEFDSNAQALIAIPYMKTEISLTVDVRFGEVKAYIYQPGKAPKIIPVWRYDEC